MNLDNLRTFLAVIETRSLVSASRRLHVTQSTVTARLNALEQEIGQKLLHRGKSGTELTSAGFKFERYAQVMVQLWRQARYEVSLPLGFEGVCNLGLEFDLWRGLGQRFLDYVRSRCPKIAIALWPGEQHEIDRWLKTGLIDLAFCYALTPGGDFKSRVLLDDELILVSSRRGARAELDAGYVYVDHGDEFRRQHAAAFPSETTSALTIASSDWAIDHLLSNGGSGYLSRRHAAHFLARAKLHAVRGAPSFKRRVYLLESAQAVAQWPWYEAAIAWVMDAARFSRRPAALDRGARLRTSARRSAPSPR
jgi:LysR family transcriptional regulator, flagellar master operon regulator